MTVAIPAPARVGLRARLSRSSRSGFLLVLPTLAILVALGIYPLGYAIWKSFRTDNLFFPTAAHFTGLGNYSAALHDSTFIHSVVLSLVWCVLTVSVELLLGLGIALLLSRSMRGIGLLRTLIVIPVFVSPVAMGLVWRFMFEPTNGVVNVVLRSVGLPTSLWLSSKGAALWGVLIADVWQWTPFMALILHAGIQSISPDITEAARLDRIRGLRYLVRIVLPLIAPVLLVALFLRLVDSIRTFDLIWIMTRGGPSSATLLTSVEDYTVFQGGDIGQTTAIGVLLLILINILVAGFIRVLRMQERRTRRAAA